MMESVKMNKGKYHKRSLLTCFKPMVAVEDDDHNFKSQKRRKHRTTDPVLAYLAAADEDGVVIFSTSDKEECGSRRRKKGREAWHALRTALYDTSLMKKIFSKRKTKKDSTSRSNNNNTESETINKLKPTRRIISSTSSNTTNSSSLFSTTSSLNSSTSSYHDQLSNFSSHHEVNNIPKSPPSKGNNCSVTKSVTKFVEDKSKRYIALCMLWIISLLILILWGKFFAILCTSIWFFFVPFRQRRKFRGLGSYKEGEFDSVQYKKKIIMEGILERSHSRGSLMNSAGSTPMLKS